MKRGLKVSAPNHRLNTLLSNVATYAPMKRGLKAVSRSGPKFTVFCSNLCPDEKGTERHATPTRDRQYLLRSNLCPDEKGTERTAVVAV